ncbi:MAG: glycoside hydrolase family 73 protein [Candidatus Riflebacteria bacterium]|nr:glycoside hydrolase family 73 protein [Candidatus Riflebacteria bacterium]
MKAHFLATICILLIPSFSFAFSATETSANVRISVENQGMVSILIEHEVGGATTAVEISRGAAPGDTVASTTNAAEVAELEKRIQNLINLINAKKIDSAYTEYKAISVKISSNTALRTTCGGAFDSARNRMANALANEVRYGTKKVESRMNSRESVAKVRDSAQWTKKWLDMLEDMNHPDHKSLTDYSRKILSDAENYSPSSTRAASTSTSSSTSTSTSTFSSAELENWRGGKLSPSRFVALLGPAAREVYRRTGVPASVTLAQAALETGWGESTIGSAKNLFGIKGRGPAGSITVPTREYVNGRTITIRDTFRKYNNWMESIEDHAKLLNGPIYRAAQQYKNNPDQYARAIHRCGYATDPNYATTLIRLMKDYNMYQWDR